MDADSLPQRLKPCGPVLDKSSVARVHDTLAAAARDGGWEPALEAAWPALAPVFGASHYLTGLARSRPERLGAVLAGNPDARLEAVLAETAAIGAEEADFTAAARRLRRLKGDLHLLTALCDLGGAWSLDPVTFALSRFADAAVQAAIAVLAREEAGKGRLLAPSDPAAGPVPGLFCIAMGKHGAGELNYSSDIDVSFFYEPDALPLAPGIEPQAFAMRLAQGLVRLLQERTADGYVFRVDLRLRPDPAATPPAVEAEQALSYYQSVGQNWERAAMIKARPCAGDIPRATAFLKELEPFVWRRSLDFAAIADIQSIKRQIHVHKVDERLSAAGADLKLGAGGIREIEFYVQTQQLILGGRQPQLRTRRTVEALYALAEAGHVKPKTADELADAYARLRGLEHRVQMLADEQTHRLPEAPAERRKIAALAGFESLPRFDASVSRTLALVNRRYGELFAESEPLSSRFGSLVFTGVEDDPETLRTLDKMGFSSPAQVSSTIRAWHHGRIPATRTERGRELFTRLAPKFLEAAQATGAPDAAFARFAEFFSGLSGGVQVQSLFLAQEELFELVVRLMAFAPELGRTLSRRPDVLDSLFDRRFFDPITPDAMDAVPEAARHADAFDAAMDDVRRIHRELHFRIGVQVMSGVAPAAQAGRAYSDLGDACLRALAPAAMAETERLGGAFPGEAAVVALGKAGSREMSARSDLDLMTVYAAADPAAMSDTKGWGAETFYGRFTQRLIAALSAPTAEGGLYKVDMQLRPSGTSGPVAVSLSAMQRYYAGEAETWEMLALTRGRVAWATSPAFGEEVAAGLEAALRRPRDRQKTAAEAREMRSLLETEKPAWGAWDLKFAPGGLVDVEFAVQFLQLVGAAEGGPLRANTAEALAALYSAGPDLAAPIRALSDAWSLQQDLAQLLKVALEEGADPALEPKGFRDLLANAGGAHDFKALDARLRSLQGKARTAFTNLIGA